MWWKEDHRGETRTNRVASMKRYASLLLIMAISLLFVSSVIGASVPPVAPEPAGTIDLSKAGNFGEQQTALGIESSPCSTVTYAGVPVYYFPVPSGYTTAFGMRFTAATGDTLKTADISLYDADNGSWGDDTVRISAYSDNAGLPGTLLATRTLPPGSYVKWPATTSVDFSASHLVFTGNFHIGISTSAQIGSGRYECMLGDTGTTDYRRSSYYQQGAWYLFADGTGPDYNFLMSVELCHGPMNPVITNPIPTDTLTGAYGTAINYDFDATGNTPPIIFSLISGPGTMNPVTGVYSCSGMPAGFYNVTIRATDGGGLFVNYTFTLRVTTVADNCSTIGYAGAPVNHFAIPNSGATAYAMRFSPVSQDTLKTVSICVHDPGDGSWGDDTVRVYIYDDAMGLPGLQLASKMLPPGSYVKYPAKTTVSFASSNLVFNTDFHVGIGTSGSVSLNKYESILSDSGATYTGRSSYFYQGQWEPTSTGDLPDYNFLIEAYCCRSMLAPQGAISGYKYHDEDHDTLYDAWEQGLQGWTIKLSKPSDPSFTPQTATTLGDGSYSFTGLYNGKYYVSEVIDPILAPLTKGWYQVAPTSVGRTVVLDQLTPQVSGQNFWNDTCSYGTEQVLTFVAGTKDNFVGQEASSPNAGLLAQMSKCYSGALPWFDKSANNQGFGHTFANLWSKDCRVMAATLCMRLTATGDVTSTDALSLGDWKTVGAKTIWGIYLNKLVNSSTGTAHDGRWNRNDTMTVCLDLAALPAGGFGVLTNMIAALQDGDLDVYIQDDTEIDWLELTVTICCDTTAIHGYKFNDRNCNGVEDGFDSPKGGFTFELHNGTTYQVVQTTTSSFSDGSFSFKGMPPGPYYVTEVKKAGWSQTAPVSCKSPTVTVVTNQTVTIPAFGNTDTTCAERYDTTILAGVNDTFSVVNGSEPAYQTAALLNHISAGCSAGPMLFYDVSVSDRCFGQSFVGNWCSPPCCVIGARLQGRIKALNGSNTDFINFGNWQALTPGSVWGLLLNSLVNYSTTEVGVPNDGSWDAGDVMSFDLDLANLPQSWGVVGLTNVMPLFHSGGFDVYLSDDTEVDYLRLVLTICCKSAPFVYGDMNHDGQVNITDAVYGITYIFAGGPAPNPLGAGDVDCNGFVNISDVVYLINWIFSGGPAPNINCKGGSSPADGGAILNRLAPQTATLKLAASDDANTSVKLATVNMHTDAEIAGAQLEFKVNSGNVGDVVFQTTERTKNLQLFSGVVDGKLRVGLVDMSGEHVIAVGDGPILSFDSKGGETDLELVSAIVCDRNAKELNVSIESSQKESTLPKQYSLSQNYPNPFNPSTEIAFAMPKAGEVRIDVINMLGQTVRTLTSGVRAAGNHRVTWDGTDEHGNDVSSGVYFYRIVSNEYIASKKMVLLK